MLVVKNPPANSADLRDADSIPESGRAWQTTPLLLPGESHGQRSLVGCSPWGCKELDMTEATWHTQKRAKMIIPYARADPTPRYYHKETLIHTDMYKNVCYIIVRVNSYK